MNEQQDFRGLVQDLVSGPQEVFPSGYFYSEGFDGDCFRTHFLDHRIGSGLLCLSKEKINGAGR